MTIHKVAYDDAHQSCSKNKTRGDSAVTPNTLPDREKAYANRDAYERTVKPQASEKPKAEERQESKCHARNKAVDGTHRAGGSSDLVKIDSGPHAHHPNIPQGSIFARGIAP
jgi:hypothetical protein